MNKVKIWGTSFSLIGDLIMSLPQLTYFKKKYPSSYIYFVIHKKIAYCAPLFLNHPLIDNIRISQEWSGFGDEDYKIKWSNQSYKIFYILKMKNYKSLIFYFKKKLYFILRKIRIIKKIKIYFNEIFYN